MHPGDESLVVGSGISLRANNDTPHSTVLVLSYQYELERRLLKGVVLCKMAVRCAKCRLPHSST